MQDQDTDLDLPDKPADQAARLCDAAGRGQGVLHQRFERDFAATGCREEFSLAARGGSYFLIYDDHNFFANQIIYGIAGMGSIDELRSLRHHEGSHAIQFNRAAIAFASLNNPVAGIALCPHDFMLAMELEERDAYSKASLLDAADYSPSKAQHALGAVARNILETRFKGWDTPLVEQYRMDAIAAIKKQIDAGLNGPDIVFVRIDDPALILPLGQSLGLSTFGQTQDDAASWLNPTLTTWERRELDRLQDRLGLPDRDRLPGFREALRRRGLTPDDFLRLSRENRPKSAPIPA